MKFLQDLKHRDWLLRNTTQLILSIDPTITYIIVNGPNDSKHLIFSDITEESLLKLFFITNTDINNNYLYLEALHVYLENSNNCLQIPGLHELAIQLWAYADSNGFSDGKKFFKPFDNNLINPVNGKPINIRTWIDIYSAMVPFIPNTLNKKLMFKMCVNPDEGVGVYEGNGGAEVKETAL